MGKQLAPRAGQDTLIAMNETPVGPSSRVWPWRNTFLILTGTVLLLDLLTKWWIFRGAETELDQLLWLTMLQLQWREIGWIVPQINPGAAWSIGAETPWLIVGLTALLIPGLIAYYVLVMRKSPRISDHMGFAMIIGGALGNAYDRFLSILPGGGFGGVRDFVHWDLNVIGINYVWPTFNIADSGITVGLAVVIIGSFFNTCNACQDTASRQTPAHGGSQGDSQDSTNRSHNHRGVHTPK